MRTTGVPRDVRADRPFGEVTIDLTVGAWSHGEVLLDGTPLSAS